MSIGKQIESAVDEYIHGDTTLCLTNVCIAVAATAEKRYPKKDKEGKKTGIRDNTQFKNFLHDELRLITMVAFQEGRSILNLRLGYKHPGLKSKDGLVTFEEIMYHIVRCGIAHEAKFPGNIEFRKGRRLIVNVEAENHLVLPKELIMGMMLAVVSAPENKDEIYQKRYKFGETPFSDLAGEPDKILDLVGVSKPSPDHPPQPDPEIYGIDPPIELPPLSDT